MTYLKADAQSPHAVHALQQYCIMLVQSLDL